ncbi:uncharacterized protein LOC128863416 [Anastrepha ludens]|uniref:uncharacterized protein LOC128863416 n=1 Tax=Anastrepha ludens TaxID=28586 RepID=UPI0023B0C8C7|nr:uncharacterized protein LOC128863416 [Anastrepha ludens]
MDARRRQRCFGCGKLEPHSAYIKYNNKNLSAIQATKDTIKQATTLATATTVWLVYFPNTKACSNRNSVPAVCVISLAHRRQAVSKSEERTHKLPQTQLAFATATGNCGHSIWIRLRPHLRSIRFTLRVIFYVAIIVGVVTAESACVGSYNLKVVATAAAAASGKTILRTQPQLPTANPPQLVVAKSHLPQPFTPATMGSCFGRCVAKDAHGGATTTSCLWRQQRATDEQEAELVSNASDKCPRENFIYRIIKFKTKQKRPQFIDKFWEQQDMQYTKLANRNGAEGLSDIQLQNLDVHNLLSNTILAKESALNYCLSEAQYAAASSRASSSLDLEWEHEYGHMRQLYQQPHNTNHSTQSLLLTTHNGSNNNLAQYTNCNTTPVHQLHALNNNNSKCNGKRGATYDNHPLHVHLNDSWQYLSHDEEQMNSLTSYTQSQSLPHAPLNVAAASLATAKATERSESRMRVRRGQQPPINERRNSSFTRTSPSHNSWSHISTPESLEWDQDEEQQRQLRVEDDNLDHETLELLHQIEQLKNRVLDETGDGLFDDGVMAAEVGDMSEGLHFVVGGQSCAEDGRKDIS